MLACADGRTKVADIPYATGMPPDVVHEIVDRLASKGALAGAGDGPSSRVEEIPHLEELPQLEEAPSLDDLDARIDRALDAMPAETAGHEEAPPDLGAPEEADAPEPQPEPDPTEAAADASLHEGSATYRKLYETRLSHLTRDERMSRVGGAIEPELSAFCFDPEPPIIHRLFENSHAGLAHARLVSAHHRTSTGLEALAKHQTFLHDGQVQRLLLRNQMVPQSLFQRILQPKRLAEVHRTMLSRDIPERSRTWARNLLRQKWPTAPSEERVELIWKTEGRVLPILIGLNLDSKSTSVLCKRQFASVIFVRNLASWSATPPPLIAHLLKQPLVKRIPQLRNMLLRHPNVTSEAKRKG